jgi:P4 family phage/plasmid primase-like protien
MTPQELAQALGKARRDGKEWLGLCPGHNDHDPSLSIREDNGKLLLVCRAGCPQERVIAALRERRLWSKPNGNATGWQGLTLEQYAQAKRLPADFLQKEFGLSTSERGYRNAPCVEQPYLGQPGDKEPYPVKRRVALVDIGDEKKTRWKKGHKARLYGLWRLPEFKERNEIILVEGESDTQTCWLHNFPALGLPGAGGWNEGRDAGLLDGISNIYAIIEPDQAAANLLDKLAGSAIRDRLRIVRMRPEIKDPSALHLLNPEGFAQAFRQLLDAAEPPPTPEETGQPPEYAEDSLATRFTEQHATSLKYVAKWGRWLLWNGSHWQEEDTLKAYDLARGICREASAEVMSWAKPNIRLAAAIASAKTVAAVERLAKADRQHATTLEQWNSYGLLFNSRSATIDLRTGVGREHSRTDYITKIAGASFDPTMATPLWDAFLAKVVPDPEVRAYLRRVCGYCLTADISEHALFFFYGLGANGKGVFLNTLRAILGDYATAAPAEMFMVSQAQRHPTEIARLAGVRLVVSQEVERNQRWAESKINALTGGDPIVAHFMRQDDFEFYPQFKLALAGNHKPSLRSVNEAVRRRLQMIPFTVTIPVSERDPELRDKLKAEWPGILASFVEGCREWQKNRLNPPKAVLDATEAYLAEEDTVGRWIEECCAVDKIYKAYSSELYANWLAWCERVGERATSQKKFSQTLLDRDFTQARDSSGKMQFCGIALQPQPTATIYDFSRSPRPLRENE